MNGYVKAHQPLFDVIYRLDGQRDIEIESVIDTGFVGYLTLPFPAIEVLTLPFIRRMPANLADDGMARRSKPKF